MTTDSPITTDTAFAIDNSSIHFGPGVTREVGFEMRRLGARRVMVVTDPGLKDSRAVAITLESLRAEGIAAALFDLLEIEGKDRDLGPCHTPDDRPGCPGQHRVTKLSPRPIDESSLRRMFLDSMTLW